MEDECSSLAADTTAAASPKPENNGLPSEPLENDAQENAAISSSVRDKPAETPSSQSRVIERKMRVLEQLKIAKRLRTVLEQAADEAANVSPTEAQRIMLRHMEDINELICLTKAVRGGYTLDSYQYYNILYRRKAEKRQGILQRERDVIGESLKAMAKERDPSLFPDEEVQSQEEEVGAVVTAVAAAFAEKKSPGQQPLEFTDKDDPVTDEGVCDQQPQQVSGIKSRRKEKIKGKTFKKKPAKLQGKISDKIIHCIVTSSDKQPSTPPPPKKKRRKKVKTSPAAAPTLPPPPISPPDKTDVAPDKEATTSEIAIQPSAATDTTPPAPLPKRKRKKTPKMVDTKTPDPPLPVEKPPPPTVPLKTTRKKRKIKKQISDDELSFSANPSEEAPSPINTKPTDDPDDSSYDGPDSKPQAKPSLEPTAKKEPPPRINLPSRKCHSCHTSHTAYLRCHFWFMNGTKCGKIFCRNCMTSKYSLDNYESITSDAEWHCPACLGTCMCKGCIKQRQRTERRAASYDRRTSGRSSAGFYSFSL